MIEDFKCLDSFNRRAFLSGSAHGIGLTALGGLFANDLKGVSPMNHIAKAKRIIYLFQSGGPSQIDLFDPKENLETQRGKELPESVRMGQRITTMTSKQKSLPVQPTSYSFKRHGQSGTSFSELIPNIGGMSDDVCVIRSMHTEAINHDPAITFFRLVHN